MHRVRNYRTLAAQLLFQGVNVFVAATNLLVLEGCVQRVEELVKGRSKSSSHSSLLNEGIKRVDKLGKVALLKKPLSSFRLLVSNFIAFKICQGVHKYGSELVRGKRVRDFCKVPGDNRPLLRNVAAVCVFHLVDNENHLTGLVTVYEQFPEILRNELVETLVGNNVDEEISVRNRLVRYLIVLRPPAGSDARGVNNLDAMPVVCSRFLGGDFLAGRNDEASEGLQYR